MNRLVYVLAIVSIWAGGGSQAFAQEGHKGPTRAQLQQMYVDYLKEEGYVPRIESHGEVVFKREGKTYFIEVNEKDPGYFRLVYPFFWKIEDTDDKTRVLTAVDHANERCKVAKVYMGKDYLWANVELFVASPDQFKPVFSRSLGALDHAAELIAGQLRGR